MVDNYLARRKELRSVIAKFWIADDIGELFDIMVKKVLELERGAE